MLRFHLDLADLTGPWRWDADRWRRHGSWIAPLAHPVLEHGLVADHGQTFVWVRERTDGVPGRTSGHVAWCRDVLERAEWLVWAEPAEFLVLRLATRRADLAAGPYGTAPVYLAADRQVLNGSWDLVELRGHCHADRLVDHAVAGTLSRRLRYSTQTVFAGVHRLTERARATWDEGGFRLAYPSPSPHIARARTVRAGIDPVDAFGRLLNETIGRYQPASGRLAVELSGGVDSANVAASLAETQADVASVGLTLDGELGEHQARRRAAVIQRFGLGDLSVPAVDHPPFMPAGPRGRGLAHDPSGDFYLEAFGALASHAAGNGIRVLFTGFGGDEMTALRPYETDRATPTPPLPPWLGPTARAALADLDTGTAPVAPIPLATLIGLAARNPGYVRRGIWPISPLADPLLIRFGESLPLGWRRGKRLLRDRLRRAGLPSEVVQPEHPENFLAVMQTGLSRHALPLARAMLTESILVAYGYVDRDRLAEAVQRAERSAVIPDILYDTVALETGLRSMLEARWA